MWHERRRRQGAQSDLAIKITHTAVSGNEECVADSAVKKADDVRAGGFRSARSTDKVACGLGENGEAGATADDDV